MPTAYYIGRSAAQAFLVYHEMAIGGYYIAVLCHLAHLYSTASSFVAPYVAKTCAIVVSNRIKKNEINFYYTIRHPQDLLFLVILRQNKKAYYYKSLIFIMETYLLKSQDILHNLEELHRIVFEVTENCNLKCDYCLYSGLYEGFESRDSGHMPSDIADAVLDYLTNIWKECDDRPHRPVFVGFYGGEPLMNMPLIKHIIDRLESTSLKNRQFIYSMTTNAVILNLHENYLVEKGFSLLISLDGPEAMDSHRNFGNGEPSFRIVEQNVKQLQSHHPEYFASNVNFNVVISDTTELEQLKEYFFDHYGKAPKLSEINRTNLEASNSDKIQAMYRSKRQLFSGCMPEIDDAGFWMESPNAKDAINYITHYTGNTFDSYNQLLCSEIEHPQLPSGTCTPFYKKMFVTVRGKILQCEKISHKYSLGHISFGKVNMDLGVVADTFNKWMAEIGVQCQKCKNANSCPQCIFQLNSMLKGKIVCDKRYSAEKLLSYIQQCLATINNQPRLYSKIINDVTIH